MEDCVLTVEDLINYSDQITEQSETKEGYSLNSSIEFEFTPLHLEVIVIGPLYWVIWPQPGQIVSEQGGEDSPRSEDRRRMLLPLHPLPARPLVALYQPTVPVAQVWERSYRMSQFQRLVYPYNFNQSYHF